MHLHLQLQSCIPKYGEAPDSPSCPCLRRGDRLCEGSQRHRRADRDLGVAGSEYHSENYSSNVLLGTLLTSKVLFSYVTISGVLPIIYVILRKVILYYLSFIMCSVNSTLQTMMINSDEICGHDSNYSIHAALVLIYVHTVTVPTCI